MEITWFNGKYIPKDEVKISPDDRGFLFADGIYEVVRWYEGFFYDMDSHLSRLKRNLRELRINWSDPELYPTVALDLIRKITLRIRQQWFTFRLQEALHEEVTLSLHPKLILHYMPLPGGMFLKIT